VALDKFFRRKRPKAAVSEDVPELWSKCSSCGAQIYKRDLEANLKVCPVCSHHHRISVEERLRTLLDPDSFEPRSGSVHPRDPLHFVDTLPYTERLKRAQQRSGRPDAILAGLGRIQGSRLVLALMDFEFSGGSMGSAVGEELVRAADLAVELHLPLVVVCASGGARMQEGAYSLMQMAKTIAALGRLAAARLPYLSVLTDPTTGGVTASFATLADVILAEPGALIGFAGPRVIQQTMRQTLPEGFQRSEFLLQHGLLDLVVDRRQLPSRLHALLSLLKGAA
jgi:acetyl-CoA carboxylase carboxyl transferase subunit beta